MPMTITFQAERSPEASSAAVSRCAAAAQPSMASGTRSPVPIT
jgi:hypothetical protein